MTRLISLFSLLLLFCACKTIDAQQPAPKHAHEHESGIFAYANNEKGKFATTILKPQHYKYDVTRKVLNDLIAAKGDKRMPAPKLKMSNSERYAAFAKPQEALIGIEVKAYDICTSFGKDSLNALAVLLAHELTHYYEKHDWTNHFVSEHKGMDVSRTLGDLKEKMKLETQADYLGGFLAYTAGYPALEVMPNILQNIYDGYRFPDKMKGYPDLPERKKIAANAHAKLQTLVSVFETANWLVAIEEYEDALKYYNHILLEGQYQSREVYNNMGVMATLAAMSYMSDVDKKYGLPLELDAASRMNKSDRLPSGFGEHVNKLLEIALGHFKTALTLDEKYAPALLNLGCVYTLQQSFFDADYHAQKAIQIAEKNGFTKTVADAKCLLGIIAALQDKNEDATKFFNQAIANGSSLAKVNKDIMNGIDLPESGIVRGRFPKESIDDVKLNQLVTKNEMGALNDDFVEKVDIEDRIYFRTLNYPQSRVLVHDNMKEESYAFFHITNSDYTKQTTKEIGIGSSRDDVINAYGYPNSTMELTNGQYMHYSSPKSLIFVMKNGKVSRWCHFEYKKKEL